MVVVAVLFVTVCKATITHTFNSPLSGTTRVSRYQKGKTNLDFTEARDSEWQWHPLGHMQDYTTLQSDNHASTPPPSFLQAGCPSWCPTNSVKALKAKATISSAKNESQHHTGSESNTKGRSHIVKIATLKWIMLVTDHFGHVGRS